MGFLTSSDGNYLKTLATGTEASQYIATSDTSFLTLSCVTYAATVGTAYSSAFGKNGTGPYTSSVIDGALPAGISLSSSGVSLSGTPTTPGLYTFDVYVEDSLGAAQIIQCQILVTSAQVVGSGVYRIVPNQTHDTLYTSVADPDNPTTADVAIIDPFFETAYIRDDNE